MATLREAKCGQTVKVVKIHGEGALKRRIMGNYEECGNLHKKSGTAWRSDRGYCPGI